jgi:hypothetical protein
MWALVAAWPRQTFSLSDRVQRQHQQIDEGEIDVDVAVDVEVAVDVDVGVDVDPLRHCR